ncbi:MAG: YcjX family protein [Pseudomonadota bacterium]
MIGEFADRLTRGVEAAGATVSEAFFEPSLRIGVTGLSQAGKTVFITALVANLMNRARMPQLSAARDGRIQAVFLQPQPDNTVPRFDFEDHLAALTGPEPYWPEGTRSVSELRLSFRIQDRSLLSGVTFGLMGPRTLHLDIVDYPGEWLLDLALLEKSYASWSEEALARLPKRPGGQAYLAQLEGLDPAARLDEPVLRRLSAAFADALKAARKAGYSDCSPGRFLLPGELAGAPVLAFAPLPDSGHAPRGSLGAECARRFEAYKREVVKPFFRDHFAKIDRQIVLADVLSAVAAGPAALEDLRRTLAEILAVFRPGRNAFLTQLLMGRRVEKVLFAATKADHIHHRQHPSLSALIEALLRDAKDRADFHGAATEALSIAALRCTTEETRDHKGKALDMVRGRRAGARKNTAFYPGEFPQDPARLLSPARNGQEVWDERNYQMLDFSPAPVNLKPGEGPPHIRLDRAAEFLIGDKL